VFFKCIEQFFANLVSRNIGFFIALLLCFFAFEGRALAQSSDSLSDSLFLRIDNPATDYVNTSHLIELSGVGSPGAIVNARGVSAVVDAEGNWKIRLKAPLKPGTYKVPVVLRKGPQELSSSRTFRQEEAKPEVVNNPNDVEIDSSAVKITYLSPFAEGFTDARLSSWIERQKQGLRKAYPGKLQLIPLEKLNPYNAEADITMCRDFECASLLAQFNDLHYLVISSVRREGQDYFAESRVVAQSAGGTVLQEKVLVGKTLAGIFDAQSKLGRLLADSLQKWDANHEWDKGMAKNREGTLLVNPVLQDTLTFARSPYVIHGTATVPAGKTLVIEPGTEVLFVPGTYGTIRVFGQLFAEGTETKPIRFASAGTKPFPWDWNRLLFMNNARSRMKWVTVEHSNFGLHVENSALSVQNSEFKDNSLRAIYARNSDVEVSHSSITGGQVVGIQATYFSEVRVDHSLLQGNRNAIALEELSQLEIENSRILGNDRGLILWDTVGVLTDNVRIENNLVGIAHTRMIDRSRFKGVVRNRNDFKQIPETSINTTLKDPQMEYMDRAKVTARPRGEEFGRRMGDQQVKELTTFGNIQAGADYHFVKMARNPEPVRQFSGDDTIQPGQKFPNIFTAPGLRYNTSIYSSTQWGENSLDLSMDGSGEIDWQKWRADPVYLQYSSPRHRLLLGDFYLNGGSLSMGGESVFGAQYRFSTLREKDGRPVLRVMGFYGENQQPFKEGEKDPDIYSQYILEGAAVPQRILSGGQLEWNPLSSLRLSGGYLESRDYTDDVLVRDPLPQNVITSEPITRSRTAFLEADYRLGRLDIKAQGALGWSDTLNYSFQNAMTRAWNEKNLFAPVMNDVYNLFHQTTGIANADSLTLVELTGFDDDLTMSELRDSLEDLRTRTFYLEDSLNSVPAEDRKAGMTWDAQHVAAQLDLYYQWKTASLTAGVQYVGMGYFSAGSPGVLQNSRDYFLTWDHRPKDWFTYNVNYDLFIENAAQGQSHPNYLGLGEGTDAGLWRDEDWHKENLLRDYRTSYTHTAELTQTWQLSSFLDLDLGYALEFRIQQTPDLLSLNNDTEDMVFADPWFRGSAGDSVIYIRSDSVFLNEDRWTDYQSSARGDTLALGFRDESWTHELTGDLKLRLNGVNLKVGGAWKWALDQGQFAEQYYENLGELADTTWEKLGLLPGGLGYFQHAYPMSLSLAWKRIINNSTTFKIRFKDYNRDEETEQEIAVGNRFTWHFLDRLFALTIGGEFSRQTNDFLDTDALLENTETDETTRYFYYTDEGVPLPDTEPAVTSEEVRTGESFADPWVLRARKVIRRETMTDLRLESTLRFNYSAQFYVELLFRAEEFQRPQDPANEYRDVSGGMNLYLSF